MKWQLGFAGAAGVLALLARSGYERKHFRVETYTIETDKRETWCFFPIYIAIISAWKTRSF